MTVYLLDTNYLVYLADDDSDEEKRKAVLSDMAEKLQQDDNRFVITPLIRYEVLRGVDWGKSEKLSRLTGVLAQFESWILHRMFLIWRVICTALISLKPNVIRRRRI